MAVKSILEIDVKDEAFTRFKALYDDYQKKLGETPGLWDAASEGIKGSQGAFLAVAAAMTAQTETLHKLINGQRDFKKEVEKTSSAWSGMATTTKRVADNILTATTTLLRWASMGGALSGLLGAGGLWGLDKLGAGAANDRRAATGLGASIGEQRAFGLNFGRYVDTDSLTGGVNDALTDPRRRFALIGAGAGAQDVASGDAVRVAASILPNLKKIADQTQDQYLALEIEKRGLQGIVSVETLRRLKATSPEELAKAGTRYRADVSGLGLNDRDARAWQDFVIQLHRAGAEIENVFQKDLVKLSGPLGHLSEVATGVVDKWLKDLKPAIDEFATYLGSTKFQADVKTFATGIGDLASGVVHGLQWIGLISKDATPAPAAPLLDLPGFKVKRDDRTLWQRLRDGGPPHQGGGATGTWEDPKSGDLLSVIRQLENSGDNSESPKGARGRYQVMPDTANDLGFTDKDKLFDPDYNKAAASAYLRKLSERYHGNAAEILAAYNGGPRRGDAFRDSGDNPNVLPRETRAYVARGQTLVTIQNQTGGNAIVTTSQLPQ